MKLLMCFLWLTLLSLPVNAQNEEMRLMRFPATNGREVVFSYAGDLYTVPLSGGVARKLTAHEGYEMFPRFSPDGKQIAFAGQYDGNTEVYLIPAEGGTPLRLTITPTLGRDDVSDRMGPNNIVMTWKNQSNEIIFRSRMRSFNDFIGQLYSVNTNGDLPEPLPLPRGGFCSFSPDDQKMAYNRVFREFRTWKRYRGGMADDIWIYDFKTKETINITDHPAQDIIPMWIRDKIYFLSDRDTTRRMNLFVYDLKTKTTAQLTFFKEFDIKFPSAWKDRIVFEWGGYIYQYDLNTAQAARIPIFIREDFSLSRGGLTDVSTFIQQFEIAPDGNRALYTARGEIFTVPAKNGITRNLTQSSGIHERNAKWSPNGQWIAYLSDQTGENEIWIRSQNGSGQPVQLTRNADTYYYDLFWSPDSRKILWADKKLRLRFVDVETKTLTEVDQSKVWEFTEYSWSPDSRWIAYTRSEAEGMPRIYLYSLADKKSYPVTDTWYASAQPVFSADGKYLFFISNRDFNPLYSWTEWNHAYQDMERIYLITLSKETESPFRPLNDEVSVQTDTAKATVKKDQKSKDEPGSSSKNIRVDLDGIMNRITVLPIHASNYYHLTALNDVVYYQRRGSKDEKPLLFLFDLKEKKETEIGQVYGYEISADGKKMIVLQNAQYAIVDLPKGKLDIRDRLNLSGLQMMLDRRKEWNQIFYESWRQMRDFLYAPNLHGVDWLAVRKQYEALLPYVNHRNDLTYLIGEMIGELNVGHAYVGGGERPPVKRIPLGLLGADIRKDPASGYFRIIKIFRGENWTTTTRSPLTEIGVNAREGDYILAVNGISVKPMNNLYSLLINTAGKTVLLKINTRPQEEGSREVMVTPIEDESPLVYYEWVRNNIEKVSRATNGQVGYIHVPDMGVTGLNEFVKHFYPQLRKKALIIDVRGNGGGNVSPMLIERLRRELVMFNMARNTIAYPNPRDMMLGPMVCLLDEFSASDGDLFPYRFRKHKLGKLIGKRSWGGVVGIRGTLPFVDGGVLNKPEFAPFDTDGKEWIIEGYGVEPDIVVDNDPAREFAGIDDQLNKAIEVILEELKTKGKEIPDIPDYPVRR